MRPKILIITALLAMMVAMIGITAAIGVSSVDAYPTPLTVGPSDFSIQKVTVTTDGGFNIADIKVMGIKDPNGNPYIITDIFEVQIDTNPGPSETGLTDPSGTTYNYGFKFKGTITGNYKVKYVSNDVDSSEYSIQVIQATLNAIPVFPKVALPVAAVIGLVFFFQQRKNKKE
jgi:hypothetical protein